jgi:molybdenum cofactor cytidylyltransferase
MNAIVILAAGSSTRMGSPKQNLNYNGQTLLQSAVQSALAAAETVLIILGANRENIEYSIKDQAVNILPNPNWAEGMASSISLAITELQTNYPQVTSAILMLCDQPHVNEELLRKLIDTANQTDKSIIASAYKDTLGVPVLFKAKYFPYLLALQGEEGAKNLLIMHADDVQSIPFPLGAVDIDTAEDFERLKSEEY